MVGFYYNFEDDEILTLEQLEKDYHEAYKNGWIQPCTFSQYMNNSMYTQNGCLVPFYTLTDAKDYQRKFKRLNEWLN